MTKNIYNFKSWSIQSKAIITSIIFILGSLTTFVSSYNFISNNILRPYIQNQSKPIIDSLDTRLKIVEKNERLIVISLGDSTTKFQKSKMLDKVRKNLGIE